MFSVSELISADRKLLKMSEASSNSKVLRNSKLIFSISSQKQKAKQQKTKSSFHGCTTMDTD
jgi:hypothetical protein